MYKGPFNWPISDGIGVVTSKTNRGDDEVEMLRVLWPSGKEGVVSYIFLESADS